MTFTPDKTRLMDAVDKFPELKIMVLGDIMLDRFIWGSVARISPEAPVPVVEVQRDTALLGGAANVLHNLIALGAGAGICGLLGQDEAGDRVKELLASLKVSSQGLFTCAERVTTVKTRIVAHSQQIVRVDRESRQPLNDEQAAFLSGYLAEMLPRIDAVIVSDYAKGVVSEGVLKPLLQAAAQKKKLVAVDPKVSNIELFAGASIITPNHLEAASAAQVSLDDDDYVRKAGTKLRKDLGVGAVLITQGEKGMTLFSDDEPAHIPTMAKQVYDVTGAGDTVISTLTLGLAAGLSLQEAAFMANCAAGLVVGEVGTSVVNADYLKKILKNFAENH